MDVSNFIEKLNKLDGKIYTIEEVVSPTNGVYEAELIHDNITSSTLNIYTGSKLTGDKINTYTTSTPSLTPWKTVIKIYSNINPLYISYETSGDTIEAEDINKVQDAIVDTQENLNNEIDRAIGAEKILENNLNVETLRAKASENTITNTINSNKPNWDDKYTKNETDNKFNQLVVALDWKESVATYSVITTTYPSPDDGWTVNVKDTDITYRYDGSSWIPISANSIPLATSAVDGKMSKQDKIDHDDMVSKRHTHANRGILDVITQDLLDTWNAAYTHVSDAVRHITSSERTLWNTVSNKLDANANAVSASKLGNAVNITDYNALIPSTIAQGTITPIKADGTAKAPWVNTTSGFLIQSNNTDSFHILIFRSGGDGWAYRSCYQNVWGDWKIFSADGHTHVSSTITDFLLTVRSTVLTGVSVATNSVITATDTVLTAIGKLQAQITTNLLTLTNHTSNTSNPHSITASQVGLGNVTNDSQVKRNEMGVANGVATLDSSGVNNQAPKAHIHDDIYYTESEADAKFATINQISQAGYGDMLKSVYDTNNDGIVDKAKTIAGPIIWNDLEGV